MPKSGSDRLVSGLLLLRLYGSLPQNLSENETKILTGQKLFIDKKFRCDIIALV